MSSLSLVPLSPEGAGTSDYPDLQELLVLSVQQHPASIRARFIEAIRNLEGQRTEFDRMMGALERAPGSDTLSVDELGRVIAPPKLWDLPTSRRLLTEFATTSRFDVAEPNDADYAVDQLCLEELALEHLAALAAYYCEEQATELLKSICMGEANGENLTRWELADSLSDAEQTLLALGRWSRAALQASAEASLARTMTAKAEAEKSLDQLRRLTAAEQAKQTKLSAQGKANRAKLKPKNGDERIVATYRRLQVSSPAREIAGRVAKSCGCTPQHVRRVAKKAGLRSS